MEGITILGIVAGMLTTGSFVPQVVKTIRTKDTKGLSLTMYLITCIGILLWLIYGTLLMNIPILAANSVTLVLAATILFLKLKYK